jgi:hypothetical protein
MTALEKAIALMDRWTKLAKQDDTMAGGYGVKISPKGYISCDITGNRIGYEAACAIVAHAVNEKARPVTGSVQPTIGYDKLNEATQAFFVTLCEQVMTATGDASLIQSVRLGHDIPKISPQNSPRLTNLKKAGLVCTTPGVVASHKMLEITPEGRDLVASWT